VKNQHLINPVIKVHLKVSLEPQGTNEFHQKIAIRTASIGVDDEIWFEPQSMTANSQSLSPIYRLF